MTHPDGPFRPTPREAIPADDFQMPIAEEITTIPGVTSEGVDTSPVKILQFPTLTLEQEEQETNRLANEFDKQVRESGAFSHMGVLFGYDYMDRIVTKVYLLQNSPTQELTEDANLGIFAVNESFNALASSQEHRLGMSIHFLEGGEGCTGEALDADLRRIASESKLQYVYSETLTPPQP